MMKNDKEKENKDIGKSRTIVVASVWLIATIIAVSRRLSSEHTHWDGVRIWSVNELFRRASYRDNAMEKCQLASTSYLRYARISRVYVPCDSSTRQCCHVTVS